MIRHGFVAELHKTWLASPATEEDGVVNCHDPSGFLGSRKMKDGGVFFPSKNNTILDMESLAKANAYCREMNK